MQQEVFDLRGDELGVSQGLERGQLLGTGLSSAGRHMGFLIPGQQGCGVLEVLDLQEFRFESGQGLRWTGHVQCFLLLNGLGRDQEDCTKGYVRTQGDVQKGKRELRCGFTLCRWKTREGRDLSTRPQGSFPYQILWCRPWSRYA